MNLKRMGGFFSPKRYIGSTTAKTFLADVIIPFVGSFSLVLLVFYLRELLDDSHPRKGIAHLIPSRHVPIHHHGIQMKGSSQEIQFQGSTTNYAAGGGNVKIQNEATWSWPDLEKTAASPPSSIYVWVVTPTYKNPYQYAELTGLAQAMFPARKLLRWLIVDDYEKSKLYPNYYLELNRFLKQFGISFDIIRTPKDRSPPEPRNGSRRKPKGGKGKGWETALRFIQNMNVNGTVYFADVDNTYDSDIFRQMQGTEKVSIWPTGGIFNKELLTSPIVDGEGRVIDFVDLWSDRNRFHMNFASFAVNASLLPKDDQNLNVFKIENYEEKILRSLNVEEDGFQPLAGNATEVLAWHTKTIHSQYYRAMNLWE